MHDSDIHTVLMRALWMIFRGGPRRGGRNVAAVGDPQPAARHGADGPGAGTGGVSQPLMRAWEMWEM